MNPGTSREQWRILSGRIGVIVAPTTLWATKLKIGDRIKLITPAGDILQVELRAFELVKTTQLSGHARGCPILIWADNLRKEDVPTDSQLWLT